MTTLTIQPYLISPPEADPSCPPPPITGKRWRMDDELGLEKQCSRCEEWWPADTEFFNHARSERGGLHVWCRACSIEQHRERNYSGRDPERTIRSWRGSGDTR